MRPKVGGISLGPKCVPRTRFLTAFRFPYGKKITPPKWVVSFCRCIKDFVCQNKRPFIHFIRSSWLHLPARSLGMRISSNYKFIAVFPLFS